MIEERDYQLRNLSDGDCLQWRIIFGDWPPGLNGARLASLEQQYVRHWQQRRAAICERKQKDQQERAA